MPKPNYYLTNAEIRYIKDWLAFSMVHHDALIKFPNAAEAGVKVAKVTKELRLEESLYIKLGGTLRKKNDKLKV